MSSSNPTSGRCNESKSYTSRWRSLALIPTHHTYAGACMANVGYGSLDTRRMGFPKPSTVAAETQHGRLPNPAWRPHMPGIGESRARCIKGLQNQQQEPLGHDQIQWITGAEPGSSICILHLLGLFIVRRCYIAAVGLKRLLIAWSLRHPSRINSAA